VLGYDKMSLSIKLVMCICRSLHEVV